MTLGHSGCRLVSSAVYAIVLLSGFITAEAPGASAASPQASGPVEVMSLRTANRQVFANADGTFTTDVTALPRWVHRGSEWVPVNPTLQWGADGRVTTVATPLELSFSPGGDTALATIAEAGRSLTMTWSQPLPRPVLSGRTARYPEVLPGVDLEVTAGVTGFSEVLVVKTAEAARQPELTVVRFGLRGEGLTVRGDGAGGARALDAGGAEVFHAPTPQMWDSSTTEIFSSAPIGAGTPGLLAAMPAEVGTDSITVRPNRTMLTGATTRFPVYIDPSWSGSKLAWAYVDKGYPTTAYWNSTTNTPASGTYNGGANVKRSYWRMDTSAIAGKHIISATFRIKEIWAYSCTARPVDLWLTNGISSSTTWNTKPANLQKLYTVNAAYGWAPTSGSSPCPAKDLEFDATSAIVSRAASGAANVTLSLQGSETDSYGWKRYDYSPHLVVNYNTVPTTPTVYGTQPGTPCLTGDGRPGINTANPKLYANVYDPDGSNGEVRAEFEMRQYDPVSKSWQAFGSKIVTAYVSTTKPVTLTAPTPSLREDTIYSWRTRAYDGIDASAWTSYCEFVVKTAAPSQLPVVTSTDYPPGSTFPDAHGSPGLPGAFTFSDGGAPDITAFKYALNDINVGTANQVSAPTGTVMIQLTPPRDQQNTLYVWSVDRAGNVSTQYATYDFFVGFASDPVGYWRFDETGGTATADASGHGHSLTWAGGRTWTSRGRVDGAVSLDGSTGYGATAAPVLRTDRSFSVSAWARLTSTAHIATVVTQGGTRQPGFQLYYSVSYNRWIFNRYSSDVDTATIVRAISNAPPAVGVWTHLVGVYDAPRQQLRLYVNGVLQAAPVDFTTPWHATGPLEVGRVKVKGAYVDYFPGDVDEVRVYDRILVNQPSCDPVASDQIPSCKDGLHLLATRPGSARGIWAFDDGAGSVAADSSGWGNTATLRGGATWDADGTRGGALAFDGATGRASTAGPVLQTDGSFTVTAWVRLGAPDSTTLPTRNATAVGQDGTAVSPFFLGYRRFTVDGVLDGYWSFSAPNPDVTSGLRWSHARSDAVHMPEPGTWTHLAGVYDATVGELRLYVNGALLARTTGVSMFSATGPFSIGSAKYSGAQTDFWPGAVDDVRAYAGTLTDWEIFLLAST
ncbi:LamG-like jellyroll fold domain-containing protein [Micromonospora sp. SL1-18]|uniref:LamG-like jellyroll fold domain-containing protein n=1 Tax=Micromonospora sp. SL1-18 TaxID=3399128 RepID=UPI003A4D79D4